MYCISRYFLLLFREFTKLVWVASANFTEDTPATWTSFLLSRFLTWFLWIRRGFRLTKENSKTLSHQQIKDKYKIIRFDKRVCWKLTYRVGVGCWRGKSSSACYWASSRRARLRSPPPAPWLWTPCPGIQCWQFRRGYIRSNGACLNKY